MSNPFFESQKATAWMIAPEHLERFLASVATLPVDVISAVEISNRTPEMQIRGQTAMIEIKGVLLKQVPSWVRFFGIVATSYADIRNQLSAAVNNPAVKQIQLHIESPGGTHAGAAETAAAIADANENKPVTATIEDLCGSAAYYLASQAGTIEANADAVIGSIGTYTYFFDFSERAKNEGVKTVLINSGVHKGMGVIGTKITDEQIAAYQEVIDDMAGHFKSAVAAGRKFSQKAIAQVSDGRVWLADKAKDLGLIDRVINNKTSKSKSGDNAMSETLKQPENAVDVDQIKADATAAADVQSIQRLNDLKAQFPDDPQFVMDQFEKGHDVTEAKAAYADVLGQRNAELQKENEQLKTQADAGAAGGGTEAIASAGEGGTESGGNFIALAKERAAEKKISLAAAMSEISSSQPGVYQKHLAGCEKKKVANSDVD